MREHVDIHQQTRPLRFDHQSSSGFRSLNQLLEYGKGFNSAAEARAVTLIAEKIESLPVGEYNSFQKSFVSNTAQAGNRWFSRLSPASAIVFNGRENWHQTPKEGMQIKAFLLTHPAISEIADKGKLSDAEKTALTQDAEQAYQDFRAFILDVMPNEDVNNTDVLNCMALYNGYGGKSDVLTEFAATVKQDKIPLIQYPQYNKPEMVADIGKQFTQSAGNTFEDNPYLAQYVYELLHIEENSTLKTVWDARFGPLVEMLPTEKEYAPAEQQADMNLVLALLDHCLIACQRCFDVGEFVEWLDPPKEAASAEVDWMSDISVAPRKIEPILSISSGALFKHWPDEGKIDVLTQKLQGLEDGKNASHPKVYSLFLRTSGDTIMRQANNPYKDTPVSTALAELYPAACAARERLQAHAQEGEKGTLWDALSERIEQKFSGVGR